MSKLALFRTIVYKLCIIALLLSANVFAKNCIDGEGPLLIITENAPNWDIDLKQLPKDKKAFKEIIPWNLKIEQGCDPGNFVKQQDEYEKFNRAELSEIANNELFIADIELLVELNREASYLWQELLKANHQDARLARIKYLNKELNEDLQNVSKDFKNRVFQYLESGFVNFYALETHPEISFSFHPFFMQQIIEYVASYRFFGKKDLKKMKKKKSWEGTNEYFAIQKTLHWYHNESQSCFKQPKTCAFFLDHMGKHGDNVYLKKVQSIYNVVGLLHLNKKQDCGSWGISPLTNWFLLSFYNKRFVFYQHANLWGLFKLIMDDFQNTCPINLYLGTGHKDYSPQHHFGALDAAFILYLDEYEDKSRNKDYQTFIEISDQLNEE